MSVEQDCGEAMVGKTYRLLQTEVVGNSAAKKDETQTTETTGLTATCSADRQHLFVACSDFNVSVYSLEHFDTGPFCRLTGHEDRIQGIKTCPSTLDGFIVYTASEDGKAFVYDLRKGTSPVLMYQGSKAIGAGQRQKKGDAMGLTCLDVGFNGAVFCVGTDSYVDQETGDELSSILFFDTRSTGLLGHYSESHTGTMSTVQFSNFRGSEVISSSMDGLICQFDISQPKEEDSLVSVINMDEPIEKVAYFGPGSQCVSAIAASGNFAMYQLAQAEQMCFHEYQVFNPTQQANASEDPWRNFKPITSYYYESPVSQRLFLFCGDNTGALNAKEAFLTSVTDVAQFQQHEQSHKELVNDVVVLATDDQTGVPSTVVSIGGDSRVNIWKL